MTEDHDAPFQPLTEFDELLAVFDGIDDVIYVADPDTYELLYVNAAFKEAWGDQTGGICHRVLQQRDEPCPYCTNHLIFGEYLGRSYVWEFQNEVTKRWYRCADKAIRWPDGRMVRFEIASDITDQKETESALRSASKKLNERIKEQTVLFELSNLVFDEGTDEKEYLQTAVNLIPAGWQFPEITEARVTFEDQHYTTESFVPDEHGQSCTFSVGESRGRIEVVLTAPQPEGRSRFLPEEQQVLDEYGRRLGQVIARSRAEAALVRASAELERRVEERTAELEAKMNEMERANQIIARQSSEILELSTPILQIWDGVVVAPLIGTLDSERTQQLLERLLTAVVDTRSEVALVDITGVPTVDTRTAQHLIEAVSSVRLLGAQVILTGISPAIAQALVHLGIDLGEVTTRASLADGLRVALSQSRRTPGGGHHV